MGLDGGVRSQMRTRLACLNFQKPISGAFSKKTAIWPPGMSKSAAAQAFFEYRDNSISGKNRERAYAVNSERAVTRTETPRKPG
jgi:hypothetical protein